MTEEDQKHLTEAKRLVSEIRSNLDLTQWLLTAFGIIYLLFCVSWVSYNVGYQSRVNQEKVQVESNEK